MRSRLAHHLVLPMVLVGCLALLGTAHALNYTAVHFITNSGQEVPPSGTGASGSGVITVDTDANILHFDITYSGLSSAETAAHIHGPALVGANAAVLFGLPAGTHKVGDWNYPEAQEANIVNGLTYVNVHSTNFPGGEMRGQIRFSDPGAPTDGPPGMTYKVTLGESVGEGQEWFRYTKISRFFPAAPPNLTAGFLVILDTTKVNPADPANWSDVVIFEVVGNGPPGTITFCSDTTISGGENQIGPMLTKAGYTVAQVQAGPVEYLKEHRSTAVVQYTAGSKAGSCAYNIISDPGSPQQRVPGLNPVGMTALFAVLAIAGTAFVWRRRRFGEDRRV